MTAPQLPQPAVLGDGEGDFVYMIDRNVRHSSGKGFPR